MTTYRARLSKESLGAAPARERQLFVSLAHLANEISALQKCLIWSSDFTATNEVVVHGQVTFSLMFLKLLAGKLFEANKLLSRAYSKTVLARDYEKTLTGQARSSLQAVKRYFGRKKNAIEVIRNNFAFHYSPASTDASLAQLPDDLDLYVGDDGHANVLYYFAEVLVGRALLAELGKGSDEAALDELTKEVVEVAGWMQAVAEGLMVAFVGRFQSDLWQGSAEAVRFDGLVPFTETKLQWFTDTQELSELVRNAITVRAADSSQSRV